MQCPSRASTAESSAWSVAHRRQRSCPRPVQPGSAAQPESGLRSAGNSESAHVPGHGLQQGRLMTTSPLRHRAAHTAPTVPVPQDDIFDLDPADMTVVRARHPWRWIAAIGALILVAMFVNGLITNPGSDWSTFGQYFTAPA